MASSVDIHFANVRNKRVIRLRCEGMPLMARRHQSSRFYISSCNVADAHPMNWVVDFNLATFKM